MHQLDGGYWVRYIWRSTVGYCRSEIQYAPDPAVALVLADFRRFIGIILGFGFHFSYSDIPNLFTFHHLVKLITGYVFTIG